MDETASGHAKPPEAALAEACAQLVAGDFALSAAGPLCWGWRTCNKTTSNQQEAERWLPLLHAAHTREGWAQLMGSVLHRVLPNGIGSCDLGYRAALLLCTTWL